MHKIFHDILVNGCSRESMLEYIATVLRHNEKRTQMQSDDRALAGDGFMLNLLSILQMLAVKVNICKKLDFFPTLVQIFGFLLLKLLFQVKMDKIDPLYPFHPNSMVDVKDETRLKLTSQEASDWIEDLSKSLPIILSVIPFLS